MISVWNKEEHIRDFADAAKGRNRWIGLGALLLSVILGGSYTAFGIDGPLLPLIVIACLVVTLLLWCRTDAVLYIIFAGACLFELFPSTFPDSLTERVPLFWNVNTIFQVYAHANFKAVPFSLVEILLIFAGLFSVIRAVYTKSVSVRGGPLMTPVLIYLGFVLWGWVNGLATGGDFKLSLQEVRAQFYFCTAYFMAVNLIRSQKQILTLWWMAAVCISIKGALYTFRRYVTIAGQPLPDQGVGSHEEAYLFVIFMLLLIVMSFSKDPAFRTLKTYLLLNTPVVLLGYLATNRRAGTAAMLIATPLMLVAAFRAFPRYRRTIAIIGIAAGILGPLYYGAFKNSESAIAQPARALRSNFQPDERDASSNAYRDAENQNQMATIRLSPLQGYGYGKRMLHAVPIADISNTYEWWDLLPHNQILWVWMRTGTVGFVAFWTMMCAMIIHCCHIARDEDTSSIGRTHAVFSLAILISLLIFGLLDLQLSNFRSMLIAGFWIGCLAVCGEHGERRQAK